MLFVFQHILHISLQITEHFRGRKGLRLQSQKNKSLKDRYQDCNARPACINMNKQRVREQNFEFHLDFHMFIDPNKSILSYLHHLSHQCQVWEGRWTFGNNHAKLA